MKSYANNQKQSQEFIDKSQNQYLKISLAVFLFLSVSINVENFKYMLNQNEQIKRMIIKYQYKENVEYE